MVSENALSKCPYEIGDVLTTRNAVDPATRWPGTRWQKITDRFILGAGGSYSVGATGGEASHTLTVNEMPSHAHSTRGKIPRIDADISGQIWGHSSSDMSWQFSTTDTSVLSTGGSAAHNNMPPYIALYFWERTA